MGGEGEREEPRCGPAEQLGDRLREQGADPAEICFYVPVAEELSISLGRECTGEEDSKEKKDDAANLAGERRLRGSIVPVPARVW